MVAGKNHPKRWPKLVFAPAACDVTDLRMPVASGYAQHRVILLFDLYDKLLCLMFLLLIFLIGSLP